MPYMHIPDQSWSSGCSIVSCSDETVRVITAGKLSSVVHCQPGKATNSTGQGFCCHFLLNGCDTGTKSVFLNLRKTAKWKELVENRFRRQNDLAC